MIDYEVLKVIWWLFIGVLLVGFAVMDGQDMGVGTLLPFLGKTDNERRMMINSVAPHWDGNQVWLITGGGAIFAAWPLVYATAFSGFYWAMLIVLAALILRPLAFDYRSKVSCEHWKSSWDWALFIGSAIPPIIFGVAFGNLVLGVPFYFDDTMRPIYTGSFFALLMPYALLCGVLALVMVIFHGANYLVLRTEGALQKRAQLVALIFGIATFVLFLMGGVWTYFGIDGFSITEGLNPAGPANPLLKTVVADPGAWFNNFLASPALFLVPALGLFGALVSVIIGKSGSHKLAIVFSALSILGIVLTPLIAIFPFILPSSSMLNAGLTIWDSTSSQLTLQIMLFVTLIFLPLVVLYTTWAYKVMSGKLNDAYIEKNTHSLY